MAELIQRYNELSKHVVAFCRHLRKEGFRLGPAEEVDALEALTLVPLDGEESFQLVLKATLCRSRKQQLLFNELYDNYWRELMKAVDSKEKQGSPEQQKKQAAAQPPMSAFDTLKSWIHQDGDEEVDIPAYSSTEALTHKDVSTFTDDELEAIGQLIRMIAKNLATRWSRRYQKSKSAVDFDLRKSIRSNLRRGGEILELHYKRHRIRKFSLVMLCDMSKSMDLYSRFLLQFMYAFQQVFKRIETFVFSTQLDYISPVLKHQNFRDAISELSDTLPHWSGGTRIGASLDAFLQQYGGHMLDARTIVLILSDGWDTGEPELLEQSMATLHQKAAQVIWLNPLAGNPDFEPSVKGMEVAMPYIDVFASAHNVESLRTVMNQLKKRA